jgi:GNAT superfamily N-acetyltransferase
VDPAVHAEALKHLQATALPYDTPSDTRKGFWWIAFDGELPVAFCGMYQSQSIPRAGYFCRSGVLPSYRGQRLQRRLIKARERKAVALGYLSVHTDTVPGNPASNNNLIATGFRMFNPAYEWVGDGACYWQKRLQ